MWRGGNNGAGARVVVVEGEVHVEGAEKLELVQNRIPSAPRLVGVAGGRVTTATAAGAKAAPDVDELAAAFIRRSKEAFVQGIGGSNG